MKVMDEIFRVNCIPHGTYFNVPPSWPFYIKIIIFISIFPRYYFTPIKLFFKFKLLLKEAT